MARRSRSAIIASMPSSSLNTDVIGRYFNYEASKYEDSSKGDAGLVSTWVNDENGIMAVLQKYVSKLLIHGAPFWNGRILTEDKPASFAISWVGKTWGIGNIKYSRPQLVYMSHASNALYFESRNRGSLNNNVLRKEYSPKGLVKECATWETCCISRMQPGFDTSEVVSEYDDFLPHSLFMQFISLLNYGPDDAKNSVREFVKGQQEGSILEMIYDAAVSNAEEVANLLRPLECNDAWCVRYPYVMTRGQSGANDTEALLSLVGNHVLRNDRFPRSRYSVSFNCSKQGAPVVIMDRDEFGADEEFSLPKRIVVNLDHYDAFFQLKNNGVERLATMQELIMNNEFCIVPANRRKVILDTLSLVGDFVEKYCKRALELAESTSAGSLKSASLLGDVLVRVGDSVESALTTEILFASS